MSKKEIVKNKTNPTTNEGNLLSLITLQQVLGTTDANVKKIVQDMAKEETRYLLHAMKILSAPANDFDTPAAAAGAQLMRDEYGKDMEGALRLASVLKSKSDEKQFDLVFEPFVADALNNDGGGEAQATRQGFKLPSVTAKSTVW